jgi:hypothetical protein
MRVEEAVFGGGPGDLRDFGRWFLDRMQGQCGMFQRLQLAGLILLISSPLESFLDAPATLDFACCDGDRSVLLGIPMTSSPLQVARANCPTPREVWRARSSVPALLDVGHQVMISPNIRLWLSPPPFAQTYTSRRKHATCDDHTCLCFDSST